MAFLSSNILPGQENNTETALIRRLLAIRNSETSKNDINYLLDQLISGISVGNTTIYDLELVFVHCCKIIPLDHNLLVVKFSQLFFGSVYSQKVNFTASTWNILSEYFGSAVASVPIFSLADVLLAFSMIIHENIALPKKVADSCYGKNGLIVKLATHSDYEIRLCALKCLYSLHPMAYKEATNIDHIRGSVTANLENLQTQKPSLVDDFLYGKVLLSSLKGLQNGVENAYEILKPKLGEILAVIKTRAFFGVPGQPTTCIPSLYPTSLPLLNFNIGDVSQLDDKASGTKNVVKTKRKKRKPHAKRQEEEETNRALPPSSPHNSPHRWVPNALEQPAFRPSWMRVIGSESEYSDSEGSDTAKLRNLQSKIRLSALTLMVAIVKYTDRRVMFGYWSSFIPDTPPGIYVPHHHTLLTVILKDPAPKVRSAAVAVLMNMLEWSRQFLSLAEDSEKLHPAFTPFSFTLGCMIKELHRSLLLALLAENFSHNIIQLLKCHTVLALNAPYHKLSSGLLSRLIKSVKTFLFKKDVDIQVAALTLLGTIGGVHPPPKEVTNALNNGNTSQSAISSVTKETHDEVPNFSSYNATAESEVRTVENKQIPWLMKVCIDNVNSDDPSKTGPLPLRLESLQVLTILIKNHFAICKPYLDNILALITSSLADIDTSVQLHAARLLEATGRALQQEVESPTSTSKECHEEKREVLQQMEDISISTLKTPKQMAELWISLLQGPLLPVVQSSEFPNLRCVGCECLAKIGESSFKLFSESLKILCITLVLGLSCDEDKNVKIAAIHTLGCFILFIEIQEEISYLVDISHAILQALEDASIDVQIQAIWAIGNLSDALVLIKDNKNEELQEEFSDMLLHKLMQASLAATEGNDKLKANAIRALGNFLKYLGERPLSKPNFTEICKKAVSTLNVIISTGTNMKSKWNACFAISSMFKNPLLPVFTDDVLKQILTSLTRVVQECKNFKVRINAALALSSIPKRDYFGLSEQFVFIWESVITALENGNHSTHVNEFRYKENLCEILCLCICHLTSLIIHEDLEPLNALLQKNNDILSDLFVLFMNKTDQKSYKYKIKAFEHLKYLQQQDTSEIPNASVTFLLELMSSNVT